MPVQVGLNLASLVLSVITLALAIAALMPHITFGLRLMRDGFVWTVMLGILGFVAFVGWARLLKPNPTSAPSEASAVLQELFRNDDTRYYTGTELDPLPLPSTRRVTVVTKYQRPPVRVVETTILPLRQLKKREMAGLQTKNVHQEVNVQRGANVQREANNDRHSIKKEPISGPFTANRSHSQRVSLEGYLRDTTDWNR